MDLHKILLFIFTFIVSLIERFRLLAIQLLHLKDLLLHYVWLFLHKFLPRRQFVLDRIPKHVAFSIADYYKDHTNNPAINFHDLVQLIVWCGQYGVEKISIYDWMGIVAIPSNTQFLADLVWSNMEKDGVDQLSLMVNGVIYGKHNHQSNRANGVHKKSILELVTLDWRAGKRAIVEAARIFADEMKSGQLELNSKCDQLPLNEYLTKEHLISAPDLLIEFGGDHVGDSTCGYPPLALRVMEIVRVPRHRGIHEITFLECLEKYSQRDRRFGK